MDIKSFLSLPHRFRWGGAVGDDCMTFCATWIAERSGIDPASDLRGSYSTRAGANAIMTIAGGAVAFMDGRLLPIGATRTDAPEDGDVGLVRMLAGDDAGEVVVTDVGAIRFGPLWASISPAGVIARRAEMVAAWRVPLEFSQPNDASALRPGAHDISL
ncbi:hypothetical protein MUO32_05120 [Shinella sp. CPCC 101442]|uniref:DUF6950 family protein n=1 Tax=Shinella sp. CPCC 101442 TaxID=2932265 RepID=UPI0021526BE4|nr:hypothetical protein [Shinella sp. CPCC 101442]MCR6498408.1 hypothetical protein [Shinella sp. CPCC 101442]